MWKPLTLSQIFSQSLWPFFQTPSPQSAQLMPIVKSLCFLFFKHTLNSFSLIHSIWLLMLSWSNNMFSISTFLITSKTPSLLQKKKRMKKHIGRRWVRQIYPPLTKILRNRPSLTFPLNSISVSPLFCYAHYVKMIF